MIPSLAAVPYLCVTDGAAAVAFYEAAFGAVASNVMEHEGRMGHAELRVGDARFFVSEEFPEIGVRAPGSIGGSPVMVVLEVVDADAVFTRAVAAGATADRPMQPGPGLRNGKLLDPFGHRWMVLSYTNEAT